MATKEAPLRDPQEETVETNSRERSTIGFPYLDLNDAVEVTKAVHAVGGSTCQWDQLAAHLQQSATSGQFRMRVGTAKLFGFLNYDRGTVTLTPLGMRLCDPQQEASARVDAFLTIPLYKAIYEQYKGATLPSTSGLETAIGNLGVAPKQKGKARQVFQRSAQQAGFFSYGSERLVAPSIKASTKPEVLDEEELDDEDEKEKPEKPNKKHLHPLIEGLIQKLPEAETQWDLQGRRKWLLAALNIFDLMYTDSDESKGSLKIEVERSSAK